jgi:hypothetical protein
LKFSPGTEAVQAFGSTPGTLLDGYPVTVFVALTVKARAPDEHTAAHSTVATAGGSMLTPFSPGIGGGRAN